MTYYDKKKFKLSQGKSVSFPENRFLNLVFLVMADTSYLTITVILKDIILK